MPSSQEIPDLEQRHLDSESSESLVESVQEGLQTGEALIAADPLTREGEEALAALQEQSATEPVAADTLVAERAPAQEPIDPAQRKAQLGQLLDALPSAPSDDTQITALANFLTPQP